MDYVPFGVLAVAAVVIGGMSILAVPPIGLLGMAFLAYFGWQALSRDRDGDHDPRS